MECKGSWHGGGCNGGGFIGIYPEWNVKVNYAYGTRTHPTKLEYIQNGM